MKIIVQFDDTDKQFDNVTEVKSLLAFDRFDNNIEIYQGNKKLFFTSMR